MVNVRNEVGKIMVSSAPNQDSDDASHKPRIAIIGHNKDESSFYTREFPDWTVIASGTLLFLIPVAIFTFLLRNHLLRGMSFGAIRK